MENITTGTMEAMASENALVKNALEMRRQLDQHMEPGAEKDKLVRQPKADVTASLLSGEIGESEIGGTHRAVSIDSVNDSFKDFTKLPADEQLKTLGQILLTSTGKYLNEQKERTIGAAVGTIEGIGELTMDLVNIAEFVGDVIVGNKEGAAAKGAKFGEAIGKTLVGGVNLFRAADQYLFNIGFEGDYYRPFRDIQFLGQAMDQEWKSLSPFEQERLKYKLATDVVAGAIPIGGAVKVTRAQKLTTALEEAAVLGNELNHSEKSSKAIYELLEEFLGPDKSKKMIEKLDKEGNLGTRLDSVIDSVEKRIAGAGGNWPTINERRAAEVVKQTDHMSCSSAVGEMLSLGKLNEAEIMDIIEFPADIEDLAKVLAEKTDGRWKYAPVSEESLDSLLERGRWATNLRELASETRYSRLEPSHTVVVDGVDELGNIKIMDPADGTRYEMTRADFNEYWTLFCVYLGN